MFYLDQMKIVIIKRMVRFKITTLPGAENLPSERGLVEERLHFKYHGSCIKMLVFNTGARTSIGNTNHQ